jgi:AraC-like DNA-binding protein
MTPPTFDPGRKDFSPYGFTCVRWTPTLMPRPDRHNEIELNLLGRGSLTYLLGGRTVCIPARRLAAFWAGIPHQIIRFEGKDRYYVMTVPLALFLQWRLPDALVQPVLHGRAVMEPDAGRFAGDAMRFEGWIGDLRRPSEERRHACLLEVEARLRRLTSALPGTRGSRRPPVMGEGRLSRVEEMARYIAQNYTRPLSVEEIGREVKLHPNYAMNLFQRTFGITILKYIIQHRLSHAQRLLATTDQLILDVALDSGFGSLSRFNETFKEAFGCTPRDYRKHHRSG